VSWLLDSLRRIAFCEAEERVEHRVYNKTQANQMAAHLLMKLTLGFVWE